MPVFIVHDIGLLLHSFSIIADDHEHPQEVKKKVKIYFLRTDFRK